MQKIVFIALLMLTVSFAGAECIEKNFYKLPVSVFNKTSLNLDTLGIEDVDSENILLSGISMIRPFTRRPRWVVSSQKLNATTFDFVSSTSQYYDGSENPIFYNGYAIDIYNRGDEKGTQLVVTQYNFEQNIELPMFSLSGEPSEDTPAFMSAQMAGDMIYVSALKPSSLEIITFKVGETSVSQMITIPIKVSNSPQMVFGGSLAANQVFMNLQDEDTLYEILVDFEKTEYYLTQVSNFNKGLSCSPYVTNVYHGSVCQGQGNGVYVTKNSKTLELLLTLGDSEKMIGTYINGDYLVTVVQDMKKEGKPMSYELWKLDTMTSVKGKVDFIICDDDSLVRSLHQSPSGDLYVLLYNKLARTIENVRLGVLFPRDIKNVKNSFAEDIVIQNFLE